MPQVIFSSRVMSLPFRTFLMDYEIKDQDLFTWDVLFKTIQRKYGINVNVVRMYDHNNKSVKYKDISKKKFTPEKYFMFQENGKTTGDILINFDIYPAKGEKLMQK